jgi:hypothetical protein
MTEFGLFVSVGQCHVLRLLRQPTASQVAVLEEQVFYPHLMSSVMETSTGNESCALQCNMG